MTNSDYTYNDFSENPDPPHQPLYLDKVLKFLREAGAIRTVLDAGCGDGNFTASLANAGYEMYGIDGSESGIEIAERRGIAHFAQGSLYESLTAPFAVDSFDAIVTVEVVEHLYSPRDFVDRAYEALQPGGLLVVTTPYWGYVKNIALAATNRMDRVLSPLWDGGHIKHWSRKTMTTLLKERGFEIYGFSGAGRAPYLWRGMINVARKPHESLA